MNYHSTSLLTSVLNQPTEVDPLLPHLLLQALKLMDWTSSHGPRLSSPTKLWILTGLNTPSLSPPLTSLLMSKKSHGQDQKVEAHYMDTSKVTTSSLSVNSIPESKKMLRFAACQPMIWQPTPEPMVLWPVPTTHWWLLTTWTHGGNMIWALNSSTLLQPSTHITEVTYGMDPTPSSELYEQIIYFKNFF